MRGAGMTKVEAKACEEGDEISRSPRRGLKVPETWEVGQQRRGGFRKGCGIVAQSSEFLLLGGLQWSEGARVSVNGTEESVACGFKGGATGGMDLLDRAQFQGPFLVGLAPASPLSQGDQSKTSATRAKAEDEHHDQSPQKREGLIHDLEVLLFDQRTILGLRGGIEAGAVDGQGQVGSGNVLSQRWSQLGRRGGRRTLGDGDVCRGRGLGSGS